MLDNDLLEKMKRLRGQPSQIPVEAESNNDDLLERIKRLRGQPQIKEASQIPVEAKSNNDDLLERMKRLRGQPQIKEVNPSQPNDRLPHDYIVNRMRTCDQILFDVVLEEILQNVSFYEHPENDSNSGVEMVYSLSVQWRRFYDQFLRYCSLYNYEGGQLTKDVMVKFASRAQIYSVIKE